MLVEVRGTIYESIKHAASSLGVTKDAIYSALNRGSIDKVGLGTTQRKPIVINGVSFRSMSQASIKLGFTRSFIGWAISSGSLSAAMRIEEAINRYKQEMK